MKVWLVKVWLYILNRVYLAVVERIEKDDDLYVVYSSHLSKDVYVCKNGESAIRLYNQMNKMNMLLNRPMVRVFYGKADLIFKTKIPVLLDLVFTWDASVEEQKKIYRYVADIPLK